MLLIVRNAPARSNAAHYDTHHMHLSQYLVNSHNLFLPYMRSAPTACSFPMNLYLPFMNLQEQNPRLWPLTSCFRLPFIISMTYFYFGIPRNRVPQNIRTGKKLRVQEAEPQSSYYWRDLILVGCTLSALVIGILYNLHSILNFQETIANLLICYIIGVL